MNDAQPSTDFTFLDILKWNTAREKWDSTEVQTKIRRVVFQMTPITIPAGSSACKPKMSSAIANILDDISCFPNEVMDETTEMDVDKNAPFLDIFLNPERITEKDMIMTYQRKISKKYFTQLDSVFPELFSALWYSSLPCAPQPSFPGPDPALVQSCTVAGRKVDCAALFTKVPTDIGMCCALNTEDILKSSEYGQLVRTKQESDMVQYF